MSKRYPEIIIVDLSSKESIYSYEFPASVQAYTIKTRGNTAFKVAYKEGGIEAAEYLTIPSGAAESEENMNCEKPLKIFVQGEVDNEFLEIKQWR